MTSSEPWRWPEPDMLMTGLNVFGYSVISIRSRRQSIDPWPTIICNIPTGIIPSCFEYDLIVFPFVTVLEYQSLINVFLTEIKAVITWSKKLQLVFCDLDPNWKDQEIKPIILNPRTEISPHLKLCAKTYLVLLK